MMQRLWSGLVPSSLRRDTMASDAVMSVGIHPYGKQMCVFALCRDLKLRIWSCQVLEIHMYVFHFNVAGHKSLKC